MIFEFYVRLSLLTGELMLGPIPVPGHRHWCITEIYEHVL